MQILYAECKVRRRAEYNWALTCIDKSLYKHIHSTCFKCMRILFAFAEHMRDMCRTVRLLRRFRWRFQRYETFIFPKYTLNPDICIYPPLICVKYIRKHGIDIMCLCRTLRVPRFPYPSNKPIQDKPRPSAPWPARRCRWSERKRWSCCYLLLWGKGFVSLVLRIKPLRCLEKSQQWKQWICESVPYLLGHAIGSVFWCF